MSCSSVCIWPILNAIDRKLVKKAKYFAILDNGSNAILITLDNEAYSIGGNGTHGPLGLGTIDPFPYPTKINILSGKEIISLVGGNNGHIVALTKDCKIYAWGSNQYKIIGDNADANVLVPTHIPLSGKVKKVAVGGRHNLAITVDLKVFAWGDNSDGQLGTGNNISSSKPIPSGAGELEETAGVLDIACGVANSYYISTEGILFSAGSGMYGALGTGVSQNSSDTVSVITDTAIKKVVAGRYTVYAITKADDTLYGWGRNDEYQLGINSTDDEPMPVRIGTFHDVGAHFDCDMAASLASGVIYVWGKTRFGAMRNPTETPLKVLDDAFIVYITSRTFRLHAVETVVITTEIIDPTDEEVTGEIKIHVGSCSGPFFLVTWSALATNSLFFKSLIKSGQITRETKDYVIVGFPEEVVNFYVYYLRSRKLPQVITKEQLLGLYTLALRYRELGLIQFLIENFGVKPPLPPKSLTIDNVCFVYQQALKDGDDNIRKLCINFILENLFPVFTSNEFLNEIECNTMRHIMQDLALYYQPLQSQVAKARIGEGGEQIITSYPQSIFQPQTEEIHQIIASYGGGDMDSLINFKTQLESQIGMEVKPVSTTPKCVTLVPPRMQQCAIM